MNGGFKTKKELIAEILKCAKSPSYFLKSYAKIQHPLAGLIPFATFNYQDDLLKAFDEHRFNIVLKARQVGITTLIGGYIAWMIYFHPDKNVLIVATKQEVAKNMIRVIKTIFKNLPSWLTLSKVSIDNKQSIELNNGSRVKATTTASDAGRSEALSLLVVDETAHIKTFSDLWIGLWPSLSRGGRAILSSTPKGAAGLFYKLYQQAQNNENNFNCRFGTYINPNKPEEVFNDRLMWWVHPQNDMKWFENETMGKSPREIAQEYECAWIFSGETFIFGEDIVRFEKQAKEPIERSNFDRNLWIWKYPVREARYLIGVDISRGDSKDFSAFHIVRIDGIKLEQVAEYKGKITPDVLGLVLVEASKKYNNAIIAVENNGGWAGQTVLKIRELNYPFLYYTSRKKGEFVDPYYAHFTDQHGSFNEQIVPGYSVTPLNRIPMLAKMEQYVRLQQIELHSTRLLDEFRTFVWNNSRPEAQKGYHDDLVLSLSGLIWVYEESFMGMSRSGNMNQALLAGMSIEQTTTRQIPQFNFNQSGIYDRSRIAEFVAEQNKIVMGNGDTIDLSWMLDKKIPVFKG